MQGVGTDAGNGSHNWWSSYRNHNYWRLSALVGMTPLMEQQSFWDQIRNPSGQRTDGNLGAGIGTPSNPRPSMGPTPQNIQYILWATGR